MSAFPYRRHTITAMRGTLHKYIQAEPAAYEFRKDRGWHWLQRLCFWVLRKIGAQRLATIKTVTYGPFERNDKLSEAIFQLVENALGWPRFDEIQWQIVMGRDTYRTLISDKELAHAFGFLYPLEVRSPYPNFGPFDPYTRGQVYGIDITVLPWVDGFALVPKTSLAYGSAALPIEDFTAETVHEAPAKARGL